MFIRQCERRGAAGMFLAVFFSKNAFRSVPYFAFMADFAQEILFIY